MLERDIQLKAQLEKRDQYFEEEIRKMKQSNREFKHIGKGIAREMKRCQRHWKEDTRQYMIH